jgi:hypothetical protein
VVTPAIVLVLEECAEAKTRRAANAAARRANQNSENQKRILDLSIPFFKNISVFIDPKSPPYNAYPVPPEGAYRAIVTDVGHGMRWTQAALAARKRGPMIT